MQTNSLAIHKPPKSDAESDFEFMEEIKGGVVPKEYIPGVKKGIESVLSSGPIAGLLLCAWHEGDPRRRGVPRRGLERHGFRDRRPHGDPRGALKGQGPAHAAPDAGGCGHSRGVWAT